MFWLRHKKTKFLFLPLTANSVDPDEMLHYVAFHLGLHCLPKYSYRSHLYIRVTIELVLISFQLKVKTVQNFRTV